MKKEYIAGIVVLLLIAAGAVVLSQKNKSTLPVLEPSQTVGQKQTEATQVAASDLGTYPYVCENGSEFTMTPSSDMASVVLTPGVKASFSKSNLVQTSSSAGMRFEGNGLVFIGAGEGITLTSGNSTLKCNPKPSADPDMAPFNFGDAGEGGGMKQDATLIVNESIVGKWQSTDDSKFVREFKAGGSVTDSYDGKVVSSGTFKVFTKTNSLKVAFPLADQTVYLQMAMSGSQSDTLTFKLDKLSPENLDLTYMDRGGSLQFVSVK